MSKKDKLLERLKTKPKNFTYQEAKTLFNSLGFYEDTKGKTSGSRVMFYNEKGKKIYLHKPHQSNILKPYQIEDIIKKLGGI